MVTVEVVFSIEMYVVGWTYVDHTVSQTVLHTVSAVAEDHLVSQQVEVLQNVMASGCEVAHAVSVIQRVTSPPLTNKAQAMASMKALKDMLSWECCRGGKIYAPGLTMTRLSMDEQRFRSDREVANTAEQIARV